MRGSDVTVFEPGQTVTVTWNETVGHPSHYRIAFDDDGTDAYADPAAPDDIVDPPVLPILLDGIPDMTGRGPRQATITLPNIECDRCTLQVIQVMYDKPPFGDGNDMYYQCADIELRVGGAPDAGPGDPDGGMADGGTPDAGTPDAGSPSPDAGSPGPDGGSGDIDAGQPPDDSDDGCQAGGGSSQVMVLAVLALLALLTRGSRRRVDRRRS